jgi:hypothetical protein
MAGVSLSAVIIAATPRGAHHSIPPHSDTLMANAFITTYLIFFQRHAQVLWEMKTVDWPEWVDDQPRSKPN